MASKKAVRGSYLPYGLHWIDEADIAAVIETLKSDWITTGPKVGEFEREFARYIGCEFAVAVNSGTSALDVAVASLALPRGSEAITTPFTFVATANALLYNGLIPVFADIQGDTHNISPAEIKRRITNKTRAIVYVDYAGQPCDMDEIKEIATENNLYLIEDAAHACGAEYKGKKVGNFADLTIFSFHPVKHITTGEGGMITTNNEELYERMRLLRNHGIDKTALERFGAGASWAYDMKLLGRNYRITDFQCALGTSQLRKLDAFIERRQKLAGIYNRAFADTKQLTIPYVKPDIKHVWHIYTVLLARELDRDRFFELIRAENIGVNVHYIPIYHFSYYQECFNFKPEDFPITEDVFSRIITLPLYPKMSGAELNRVIEATKRCL